MKHPLTHLEEHRAQIRLTSAERGAMRARLMSEMRLAPAVSIPSPYRGLMRAFAFVRQPAVAMAALVLILASGGTAFAAERALPGEPLYGVKLSLVEPIQGTFESSPKAQAAWQVALTERRLAEADAVAGRTTLSTSTRASVAARVAASSEQAANAINTLASADSSAASDVAKTFDATLSAHTGTLAVLTAGADASTTPVLAAELTSAAGATVPAATSQAARVQGLSASGTGEAGGSEISGTVGSSVGEGSAVAARAKAYTTASALFIRARALAHTPALIQGTSSAATSSPRKPRLLRVYTH